MKMSLLSPRGILQRNKPLRNGAFVPQHKKKIPELGEETGEERRVSHTTPFSKRECNIEAYIRRKGVGEGEGVFVISRELSLCECN